MSPSKVTASSAKHSMCVYVPAKKKLFKVSKIRNHLQIIFKNSYFEHKKSAKIRKIELK